MVLLAMHDENTLDIFQARKELHVEQVFVAFLGEFHWRNFREALSQIKEVGRGGPDRSTANFRIMTYLQESQITT